MSPGEVRMRREAVLEELTILEAEMQLKVDQKRAELTMLTKLCKHPVESQKKYRDISQVTEVTCMDCGKQIY